MENYTADGLLSWPWVQIFMYHVFRTKTMIDPKLYQHHIILPTGACILIVTERDQEQNQTQSTPIFVLFPSLTSCAEDFGSLINHVSLHLKWRVAIVHKRGQHCPTNPDNGFEMIGDDDETETLLLQVRSYLPYGPMVGFGLSAGAIMMSRFLCTHSSIAERIHFLAGAAVSGAFDFSMIHNGSGIARCLLAWKCQSKFNLPWSEMASSIWHIAHANSPIWSRVLFQDFIHRVAVAPHIAHLRVPLLSIHSRDDPVFGWDDSYHLLSEKQPLLQLMVTEQGSHGIFINGQELSWAEKRALHFLSDKLSSRDQ